MWSFAFDNLTLLKVALMAFKKLNSIPILKKQKLLSSFLALYDTEANEAVNLFRFVPQDLENVKHFSS